MTAAGAEATEAEAEADIDDSIQRYRIRVSLKNTSSCSFVRSSFRQKTAPRISRKPVDLESLNFTVASILTLSTATSDIISLSSTGRKLWRINCQKYPLRRSRVAFFHNGLS